MIDLLVTAGLLVDGSGSAALPGSVAIRGDRIVAVLRPDDPEPPAARRIDAANRIVTPGFVDVHEHSDVAPFVEPGMDSMLRQGVTTVVVGNCGMSAVPVAGVSALASLNGIDVDGIPADWGSFAGYLDRIDEVAPAVNVAALVGHGTLRAVALGEDQRRPPDRREVAEMRQVLDAALKQGALGLSTGLIYVPGIHATTDEIADLAVALRGVEGSTRAISAPKARACSTRSPRRSRSDAGPACPYTSATSRSRAGRCGGGRPSCSSSWTPPEDPGPT